MATILTTSEMAEKLGTDTKTLRRFFRSSESTVTPVGQGNRYSMTAADFRKVTRAFNQWTAKHSRRTTPEPVPAKAAAPRKKAA